jgi:hypothetical protein
MSTADETANEGVEVVRGEVAPAGEVYETTFFGVLRERGRPIDASPAVPDAPMQVDQRLQEAEAEISSWLDEAEEEGAAILQRARSEAARLRESAHEQAERLRQAAERARTEAARGREQMLREAQADAARLHATTSEQIAAALREADEQAGRRRRAAADEAAVLLAESRLAAERQMRSAAQEAEWRLRQAQANAGALESRAVATVSGLQADVGLQQQQLTELVEHAVSLLPALDTATKALAEGAAAVAAGHAPPPSELYEVNAEPVAAAGAEADPAPWLTAATEARAADDRDAGARSAEAGASQAGAAEAGADDRGADDGGAQARGAGEASGADVRPGYAEADVADAGDEWDGDTADEAVSGRAGFETARAGDAEPAAETTDAGTAPHHDRGLGQLVADVPDLPDEPAGDGADIDSADLPAHRRALGRLLGRR